MTTMTGPWLLELPWPRPPLNQNQRMHWAPKARITREIGAAVFVLALAAKLPKGIDRAEVVLHWQPKTRRRRDTDNPSPTLKAAIDGLTRYGLTPDDDSLHVTSAVVIEPVATVERLWLSVAELSGSAPTGETP